MAEVMMNALDLFAGAGGLGLGLRQAGIVTAVAVEIDRHAVETLAHHSPAVAIMHGDARQIDFQQFRGKVELVCGGPPCQPFSSGGLRMASGDRRDLLPRFAEAIAAIRPAVFLMENVPGLAAGDRKAYLTRFLDQFAVLGYTVAWKILNAADYGVPQGRQRLFIVGMRGRLFQFPAPTHGPGCPQPHVAVGDVLPPIQLGEPNPATVVYAKKPQLRPSPYHGLLFNGGGRPIDRKRPAPTILASAGGNKTHFFDELDLVPDYHRHLLNGGAPRVGTLPGARRLTIQESALLQTFPADTAFQGPRSAQYEQIGNAVPPALAAILGGALVEQSGAGQTTHPYADRTRAVQQRLFQERKAVFMMTAQVVDADIGARRRPASAQAPHLSAPPASFAPIALRHPAGL